MGNRNDDKHTLERNKKQKLKLQRNYFITYSLQIICKHNKNQIKWTSGGRNGRGTVWL